MNQTWENGKKKNILGPFWPFVFFLLARFGPNLIPKNFFRGFYMDFFGDFKHCYKLPLHAISRKTNKSNLKKWQVNLQSFSYFETFWCFTNFSMRDSYLWTRYKPVASRVVKRLKTKWKLPILTKLLKNRN